MTPKLYLLPKRGTDPECHWVGDNPNPRRASVVAKIPGYLPRAWAKNMVEATNKANGH